MSGLQTDESTDTSNNEEALDTDDQEDAEDALNNEDTSFDDFDDEDETEESDGNEDTDDEATDSDDEDAEEESDSDAEDDSKTDEDAEADDTTADESETDQAVIDERAAKTKAWQEREAQRKAEKLAAQQAYLDNPPDDAPQDQVVRQLQVEAYNNMVERNTNKLESSLNAAVANIDLFKSSDPVLQKSMFKALDTFEKLHVRKDANGDPVEVTGDLYQYLQEEADSIRELAGAGARKQTLDKSKQRSKTTLTPVRAPKKAKTDQDLDAFDEEATRY